MARAASLAVVAGLAAAHVFAAGPDPKAGAAASARQAASSAASAAPAAAIATPIEFDGTLEPGKTYVADVAWDNNALHIWRPAKDVKVPRHHAWTLDWTNLAKFPALKSPATRAKPQRFQFKVVGVDVSSGSPAIPWTTIFRCEVLAVDPVAGAPAPAARRK